MTKVDVVKQYIDFLYRELGREADEVLSIKPGKIVLRGVDILNHPHVKLWYRFLEKIFVPPKRDIALILPCTSIKPYRISATHILVESKIHRYGLKDYVYTYVLSEPMLLVPRDLDIYYPFANYDFPPTALREPFKRIFIEKLSSILSKIVRYYRKIVAVLPRTHFELFTSALKHIDSIDGVEVYTYGRLAFKTLSNVIDKLKHYVFSETK